MARTGRKVTTASLETKIEKQKEILAKSKAKYEADKAEMLRLVKLRDSKKTGLNHPVFKDNAGNSFKFLCIVSDNRQSFCYSLSGNLVIVWTYDISLLY